MSVFCWIVCNVVLWMVGEIVVKFGLFVFYVMMVC